jgi:hypothetical protein
MALRAKKPEAVEKRLKALFYGSAGVGKTMAAIQFPAPYLIDTERGAENEEYVAALDRSGGAVFQTNDFDEIVSEVKSLLSEDHQYKTLVIDPITTVYDDLIQKAEAAVGTDFGRHYGYAKKEWKRLSNLIMRLDMNVIVTAHAKNMYGDSMKVLGKTYDGPKGLDHFFDIAFCIDRRGEERVGIVTKTRMGKKFAEGDVFPFGYEHIAKRYGGDVMERASESVELASPEQVSRARQLAEDIGFQADKVEAWLNKQGASEWSEVAADAIERFIAGCESKLEGAMP